MNPKPCNELSNSIINLGSIEIEKWKNNVDDDDDAKSSNTAALDEYIWRCFFIGFALIRSMQCTFWQWHCKSCIESKKITQCKSKHEIASFFFDFMNWWYACFNHWKCFCKCFFQLCLFKNWWKRLLGENFESKRQKKHCPAVAKVRRKTNELHWIKSVSKSSKWNWQCVNHSNSSVIHLSHWKQNLAKPYFCSKLFLQQWKICSHRSTMLMLWNETRSVSRSIMTEIEKNQKKNKNKSIYFLRTLRYEATIVFKPRTWMINYWWILFTQRDQILKCATTLKILKKNVKKKHWCKSITWWI